MSRCWSPIETKSIAYLLGRKKMLRSLPEYYSRGDEAEAVFYVKENLEAWKITRGALGWLLGQTK
jgi:hypothetical protein